jgi:hypothetical protein
VFEPDATNPNAGLANGSTPAATKAVFGRIFYTDYRGKQIADPFVFKSDYIKLRNITLSYDFSSLIGSNVKFVKGCSYQHLAEMLLLLRNMFLISILSKLHLRVTIELDTKRLLYLLHAHGDLT